MTPRLSAKIGIISLVLIIIIACSSIIVDAQSPAPGGTVTVTANPTPTKAPAITSLAVAITKASNSDTTPPNSADVNIKVSLINVNLSVSKIDNGLMTGMLIYCYDMAETSQGASSTPSPTSVVPTITSSSVAALNGQCLVTVNNVMTFQNVSLGGHTFSVELVNSDGSSLNPQVHFDLKIDVFLPQ